MKKVIYNMMSCEFVYFTSLSCGVVSLEQGKNEKKDAVLKHKPKNLQKVSFEAKSLWQETMKDV